MTKVIIIAILLAALYSCANGDSDNVSPASEMLLKQRTVYEIKPDNTYVELNTGRKVKLQYDTISNRVTEQITNREIDYFVDQVSIDTVDAEGFVVNNRMRKKTDGTYVALQDTIPEP